ncbi:hypothetical protein EW026_g5059 [Hermanssonia centrifuga]|uniref:Complex 1 LYR protein domain-containing protein n=1 Tax=Hermanssonia centrifuga TaxID=98765 RepID=A0A4S4KFA2_9APHY|nr:hypothetical protein EW026_g5059 [Hermanssonia centrifuga]
MTTIPARLARVTRVAHSPEQARAAVIQLYRDWWRGAPEIISIYTLNVTVPFFRQCIRRRFEENRYVSDTRSIDHLVLRGRQEYQETMNFWKNTDHIMGILLAPKGRPQRSFLQKFYEGRDEDQVLPAATGLVNHVP